MPEKERVKVWGPRRIMWTWTAPKGPCQGGGQGQPGSDTVVMGMGCFGYVDVDKEVPDGLDRSMWASRGGLGEGVSWRKVYVMCRGIAYCCFAVLLD